MLVLTRKLGETIWIGPNICVTVTETDRGSVKLGIDAPRNVEILRGELRERIRATDQNKQVTTDVPADGQPATEADDRNSRQKSWIAKHSKPVDQD